MAEPISHIAIYGKEGNRLNTVKAPEGFAFDGAWLGSDMSQLYNKNAPAVRVVLGLHPLPTAKERRYERLTAIFNAVAIAGAYSPEMYKEIEKIFKEERD